MNTIICMQSPMITRLVRMLDEHLSAQDIPPCMDSRSQFLTRACKIDFTTIHPVRSLFDDNRELFNAYLDFSQAVIDSWDQPPSVRSIEVISVNEVNAKLAMEFY
ncbi:hypothetical protein DTU56_24925 [Salmonella enterica subsp. enterica serovar Muenchen]|uniref:Uncharacterized protein n=1 Tax=Salmonella muenchen TaxID=596 RepID=A0A5U8XWW8_SALMU|nr:hypothetical protein [Salmonella enterica subsp. enterica serovar Muenchen]EGO2129913.1 hypothetical protein [Salmonella enterica]QFP93247.1 hypothetical protein [Serratia phage PCH45]